MTTKKKTKTKALNIRNVPDGVKCQFKAFCARRGLTMKDAIVELMREASSKDGK